MDINYKNVESKEALVKLIQELATQETSNWENLSTQDFLEAMAAWIDSSGNFYNNFNLPTNSDIPSWQLFADAIQAATIYE